MKRLLFIDTNIYLDFYRVRGDLRVALLQRLDAIKDKIIVTHQVEMEFKKNRQTAILESLNLLKAPTKIPRPPVLSDHKSYVGLQNDLKRCTDKVKKLQNRLLKVFSEPVRHDPVYKVIQRILSKNDTLNLTRQSKDKNRIRRAAFRRFLFGYPPRKPGETSIGDAVNWEWICEVAQKEKASVTIVSRDSDFGVNLDGRSYLNDWLDSEFRDRVSLQRKIRLTDKLSDALKDFDQAVTAEEVKAEVEFIKASKAELQPREVDERWASLVRSIQLRSPSIDSWMQHLKFSEETLSAIANADGLFSKQLLAQESDKIVKGVPAPPKDEKKSDSSPPEK